MDARKTSIISLAALSATILAASFLHIPPDWKLAGVEKPSPTPRFSISSYLSGAFSSGASEWITRHFGFRGAAIRIAHQLDWEIFGVLPKPGGTPIDIGLDHWIFEHEYIRHYVKRFPVEPDAAEAFAVKLATLHKELRQRGKCLVVCMSPSKPAVYPEKLTPVLTPRPMKPGQRPPARDTVADALSRHDIPFFDSTKTFLSWKESSPLLFPANGSHWNAYSAQRAFNEIWGLARHNIPSLPKTPEVTGFANKRPLPTDSDLCALYNMIAYPHAEKSVPYPILGPSEKPRRQIRIFGVGDSFSFQLADAMGRTGVVSDYTLLYYNKAEYRFHWEEGKSTEHVDPSEYRTGQISLGEYDISKAMKDCDIVLVEFNDVFASQLAWGFADEAIKQNE